MPRTSKRVGQVHGRPHNAKVDRSGHPNSRPLKAHKQAAKCDRSTNFIRAELCALLQLQPLLFSLPKDGYIACDALPLFLVRALLNKCGMK